ncbi:hypothetical protein [Endozoicomonas sp. 4G]|uniref:hypothetical protein n=1 Tax=Endozoicomonas sp. 4G TaxID=2872754 RepID=UPI002078723E|nr:hypothetical protein [Endozoicomonas sp. 4G]
MSNTRPNALSLAVAVAISSSIFSTQALANRWLQTRSNEMPGNELTEFINTKVLVQPTLGDDQQPVPQSFTTTYAFRTGYRTPFEGFTDVFVNAQGDVSSVDQFEIDERGVARKYTKVLKVGKEGIFKFTHNLAEKKLVIEVRSGMTDQDSIAAVQTQSGNSQPLEPLTKVANPEQLTAVLKGASGRAGNLGEADHYVDLATIEVEEVDVGGRTFMRLILGADEPVDLQRLGQSLFVNDEVLLAAATSAYTQVHVLEEGLQQEALNNLLSYQKPVGYVVHVEDDTQVYPVPAGYPKLEVTDTPHREVLLYGQKQNPTDVAFVKNLYNLWEKDFANNPATPITTQVQIKIDKVKNYLYVVRNRQMELLEEMAAEQDTGLNKDKLVTFVHYDSIERALSEAFLSQVGKDEFELTTGHIRLVSKAAEPTLIHDQFLKRFSSKPALKNLLSHPNFPQYIGEVKNVLNVVELAQDNIRETGKKPVSEDVGDTSDAPNTPDTPRQLVDVEYNLEKQQIKGSELTQLRGLLTEVLTEKVAISEQNKLKVLQLRQDVEDELARTRTRVAGLKYQWHTLDQKVKRVPGLEQQVNDARADATKAYKALLAKKLGIDKWDETLPVEEQVRLIEERFYENKQVQPENEVAKANLVALESLHGIIPDDEKDLNARYQANKENGQRLAILESRLGLKPHKNDDLDARQQAIVRALDRQRAQFNEQSSQDQQNRDQIKTLESKIGKLEYEIEMLEDKVAIEAVEHGKQLIHVRGVGRQYRYAFMAEKLGIDNWNNRLSSEVQEELIEKKIDEIYKWMEMAATAKPAAIGGQRVNKNNLRPVQYVQQLLQERERLEKLSNEEVRKKLTIFEGFLGLVPQDNDDFEARHQAIQQQLEQQAAEIVQRPVENQQELEQPLRDVRTVPATEQPDGEAAKSEPAGIGSKRRFALVEKGDLDTLRLVRERRRLEQKAGLPEDDEVENKLALLEGKLGLIPEPGDDFETRRCGILDKIRQHSKEAYQQQAKSQQELAKQRDLLQSLQEDVNRIPVLQKVAQQAAAMRKEYNTEFAAVLGISDWDNTQPLEKQARMIVEAIRDIKKSVAPTSIAPTSIAPTSISPTPVATRPVATISVATTPVDETDATTAQLRKESFKKALEAFESEQGITPDNESDLDARYRFIEQHLRQKAIEAVQLHKKTMTMMGGLINLASDNDQNPEVSGQSVQRQGTQTDDQKEAELKTHLKTLATALKIKGFNNYESLETQQKRLTKITESLEALETRQQHDALHTALRDQLDLEFFYTLVRKETLAKILGIDPNEDITLEDRQFLESTVQDKLFRLAELEQELEDIRTPGHPKAMPEVLKTLRAVGSVLKGRPLNEEDDVYLQRILISEGLRAHIKEARQQSEQDALMTLHYLELVFNIRADEGDDTAVRLARLDTRIDPYITDNQFDQLRMILWDDDLPLALKGKLNSVDTADYEPDPMDMILWRDTGQVRDKEEMEPKLTLIRERLVFKIEQWDQRAREKQAEYLLAIEDILNLYPWENPAAIEKGKAFTAKLASDLQLPLEQDQSLYKQKYALRDKIQALREEVNEPYDDQAIKRIRNNEMAQQLNIEDYQDHAPLDDQKSLIEAKLQQLDEDVFNAGQPDVNERVETIENKLDREVGRLGPKPRYALEREAARARQEIKRVEIKLEGTHRELGSLPDKQDDTQLGDSDGADDKTGALTQKRARLERQIEAKKAEIEERKEVLRVSEKALEDDGGPSQYTPEQEKILEDIDAFTQHPLKRQALEAAIGMKLAALESGKVVPLFTNFDFDHEFAPIHLRAIVGDKLTFTQASRIVEEFKDLKTTYPEFSSDPVTGRPRNAMKELEGLAFGARWEMGQGAKQYDKRILKMGEAGIHYVEHEPKDLKDFSEYFAAHSASGNKIITLLREGLISKAELANYMEAVKGVDGDQAVAEFEHFLGSKHGVEVRRFKRAVRRLSDKDTEAFMQSAFEPVTVTATGPAGMKESVAGMKEYAAAVIANYVLDDIAFDNGRRTAAFLTNAQDTLTPYANAAGISESEMIMAIHDTLMQAHATAVEHQLNNYWLKPSAFLVQAVTWYFTSYKPLLATRTALAAAEQSLINMSFLYLLDLTNRGDYLHRMLIPFQHWLEHYGVDLDRTKQYAYHRGIEQIAEVGGLAMPLGKAASSAILLKTGSELFARQYQANPQMYRSISRLVPEMVKSMGSAQGVQVPLLHRVTPQTVKTLASATAGLVLGPITTVGAYAHGLISGLTYPQTLGFALASSLTFDFFMNDNKMLTQWLGGPLGRSLDRIDRWWDEGETNDDYVKRTAVLGPQRFNETDEAYASCVKASNRMYGWTRHENYLQFRERRDRTMKLFDNGWEKYFKENVPKWSFSHPDSVPYSYTLGVFFGTSSTERKTAAPEEIPPAVEASLPEVKSFNPDKNEDTHDEF